MIKLTSNLDNNHKPHSCGVRQKPTMPGIANRKRGLCPQPFLSGSQKHSLRNRSTNLKVLTSSCVGVCLRAGSKWHRSRFNQAGCISHPRLMVATCSLFRAKNIAKQNSKRTHPLGSCELTTFSKAFQN